MQVDHRGVEPNLEPIEEPDSLTLGRRREDLIPGAKERQRCQVPNALEVVHHENQRPVCEPIIEMHVSPCAVAGAANRGIAEIWVHGAAGTTTVRRPLVAGGLQPPARWAERV